MCIYAAIARIGNMNRMSAALDHPKRHPFSVEEYLRMGEGNVFAPDARLELIEGEIIEMAPIGSPHAGTVAILSQLLWRLAGDRAVVWAQNPIRMGDLSMPQPDVVLLRPRPDMYTRSHPVPADVLLLIEVSDTTLRFDVSRKMPLYARAGIFEAWVVDVESNVVHVFRDADASGYRTTFAVPGGGSVRALAMPGVEVAVSELFPR
jgi:Uma2 family endonuclease